MRNNCVKLFKIWASGSGENAVKKISYLDGRPVRWSQAIYVILEEGIWGLFM